MCSWARKHPLCLCMAACGVCVYGCVRVRACLWVCVDLRPKHSTDREARDPGAGSQHVFGSPSRLPFIIFIHSLISFHSFIHFHFIHSCLGSFFRPTRKGSRGWIATCVGFPHSPSIHHALIFHFPDLHGGRAAQGAGCQRCDEDGARAAAGAEREPEGAVPGVPGGG